MSVRNVRADVGALERLTENAGFAIAFALSVAVVAPTLLAGLLGAPILIWFKADRPSEWVPTATLVAGGCAGTWGWLRAHRHDHEMWHGRIEATLVLLAVGIAAALGGIGTVANEVWLGHPARRVDPGDWLVGIFVAAHAIVIVRALGWMRRLVREYTVRTGIRFDGLPLVFLLLGIALAACVLLIATRL
jgi:hypothetical protein